MEAVVKVIHGRVSGCAKMLVPDVSRHVADEQAMIALITDNQEAIVALCREHGVRRLSVFGSAATDTFDPATSDVDFVIDYFDWSHQIFHRFFGLIVKFEDLLGRRVDMVTMPIKDPYFREEVERTMEVIYESSRHETAA